jgi:hypothetical protein
MHLTLMVKLRPTPDQSAALLFNAAYCVFCGFAGPADTIALENIRRAAVMQPYAAGQQPSCKPLALAMGFVNYPALKGGACENRLG